MTVNQRMELRQAQTLVMTPRLQQAIRLLEMSGQELSAYVEREIEQNPLLERADTAEPEDGADADVWASTAAREGEDRRDDGSAGLPGAAASSARALRAEDGNGWSVDTADASGGPGRSS